MFPLRLPEDVRKWLEENIPKGKWTEFIIASVRKQIGMGEPPKIQVDTPISRDARRLAEWLLEGNRGVFRSFDDIKDEIMREFAWSPRMVKERLELALRLVDDKLQKIEDDAINCLGEWLAQVNREKERKRGEMGAYFTTEELEAQIEKLGFTSEHVKPIIGKLIEKRWISFYEHTCEVKTWKCPKCGGFTEGRYCTECMT